MEPKEILEVEKKIIYALKNIYDPEIPVNIYDLGLVYDIDYTPAKEVFIRMTFTAPNCPMADQILKDVHDSIMGIDGVEKVDVTVTFDPVWNKEMISEEALLEMGLL